jgi:hypothetical protein
LVAHHDVAYLQTKAQQQTVLTRTVILVAAHCCNTAAEMHLAAPLLLAR